MAETITETIEASANNIIAALSTAVNQLSTAVIPGTTAVGPAPVGPALAAGASPAPRAAPTPSASPTAVLSLATAICESQREIASAITDLTKKQDLASVISDGARKFEQHLKDICDAHRETASAIADLAKKQDLASVISDGAGKFEQQLKAIADQLKKLDSIEQCLASAPKPLFKVPVEVMNQYLHWLFTLEKHCREPQDVSQVNQACEAIIGHRHFREHSARLEGVKLASHFGELFRRFDKADRSECEKRIAELNRFRALLHRDIAIAN
jgi:hypothetical protein